MLHTAVQQRHTSERIKESTITSRGTPILSPSLYNGISVREKEADNRSLEYYRNK